MYNMTKQHHHTSCISARVCFEIITGEIVISITCGTLKQSAHLLVSVDDFLASVQALDDVREGAFHVAQILSQLLLLLEHSAQLGLRQLVLLLVLGWTSTKIDLQSSRVLMETQRHITVTHL